MAFILTEPNWDERVAKAPKEAVPEKARQFLFDSKMKEKLSTVAAIPILSGEVRSLTVPSVNVPLGLLVEQVENLARIVYNDIPKSWIPADSPPVLAWINACEQVTKKLTQEVPHFQYIIDSERFARLIEDGQARLKQLNENYLTHISTLEQGYTNMLQNVKQTKKVVDEGIEQAKKSFSEKAMTEFGSAFKRQAELSRRSARFAMAWVYVSGGLAVAILLIWPIFFDGPKPGDPLSFGHSLHLLTRVASIALLSYIFVHFLRKATNLDHSVVANEHRANLCMAFLNLATFSTPEERKQYLDSILPQIAPLGETGFLGKEVLPAQVLQTLTEAIVKKGGKE